MPQDPVEQAEIKARELGIETHHELMGNGEFRFRLKANDGSSYVRTVAAGRGSWQQSHFHELIRETYIVQTGWAAFVEYRDTQAVWQILTPGEVRSTVPPVPHNVYLPAGAVIHTVKHGTGGSADWHPHGLLDQLTIHLTEADILSRTNQDDNSPS